MSPRVFWADANGSVLRFKRAAARDPLTTPQCTADCGIPFQLGVMFSEELVGSPRIVAKQIEELQKRSGSKCQLDVSSPLKENGVHSLLL